MSYNDNEKRKNPRHNCLFRISYIVNDKNTEEIFHGHILNISESGICMFTTNILNKDEKITIKNNLPISYNSGNVRWVKKFGSNIFKSGVMLTN
ncbi:MAG: PilZ domain-containing protein [Nitrospirota bacterium]